MKKYDYYFYKELENWYLDRIVAGEYEEIGSTDSYEDETGYTWFICKSDVNRYDLTTMYNPLPFAIGRIDDNGKPIIVYI